MMRGRANAVVAALLGGLTLLATPTAAAAIEPTAVVRVLAEQTSTRKPTPAPTQTTAPAPVTPEQKADNERRVTIAIIAVLLLAIVFFGRKYRKKWGKSAK
ncbi:hypothetical protein [Crossiella sp. NPDC003009]